MSGVIHEGIIAAALTSLMILIFLGLVALDRSSSRPRSQSCRFWGSLMVLSALGETINIMTLGGLALAVGILVDDATVTYLENIRLASRAGQGSRDLDHGRRGADRDALAFVFCCSASASCSCRCFS